MTDTLAAIRAAPDDADLRRVFADELLEHGDPWGELIAEVTPRRAREVRMAAERRVLAPIEGAAVATWRLGFIERLEVRHDVDADDLVRVLAHPELAALRELDLRGGVPYQRDAKLRALAALVGDRPLRWLGIDATSDVRDGFPHLRGLAIPWHPGARLDGLVDIELGVERGDDLAQVFAAIPLTVERLVLALPDGTRPDALAPIRELPALRHLGIMTSDASAVLDAFRDVLPRLLSLGVIPDDRTQDWIAAADVAHLHLFAPLGDEWLEHRDDLGHLLMRLGRDADALELFDRILLPRDTAEAWNDVGIALGDCGRWEEALAAHERASDLDPQSFWSLAGRAEALAALHRHGDAAPLWARVTSRWSGEWQWQLRGESLAELGRTDEALVAFEHALAAAPDYFPARKLHAELLADLGDARAKTELEALARDYPEFASSAVRLGRLARLRGALDEARAAFSHVLAIDRGTDRLAALANLVDLALELGDRDGALAVADDPTLRDWVLLELGRADEALASFLADDPYDYHGRALALHAVGRTADAIAALADDGRDDTCAANRALAAVVRASFGELDVLAALREGPNDPRALYTSLEPLAPAGAHDCSRAVDARRCALAALAAAMIAHDDGAIRVRAEVLVGAPGLALTRQWEVRGALRAAGVDLAPILPALRAVEVGPIRGDR